MANMKIYRHNGKCNICGTHIRARREQMHISQEQLAAKLQLLGAEINQKAISRIETGQRVVPDYEVILFAKALEVNVLSLLEEHIASI